MLSATLYADMLFIKVDCFDQN